VSRVEAEAHGALPETVAEGANRLASAEGVDKLASAYPAKDLCSGGVVMQTQPAISCKKSTLSCRNLLSFGPLGAVVGPNVWLLKGYFDTVPRELDEAAMVDGASHARIFFTMTLRLAAPILATVFTLSFVGLFSEFLLASIFLRDVDSQTLGVGLWAMQKSDKSRYFGQFCAGAMLASLPVVLLYLGFQKQLVGGLTQGSVK